MSDISPPPASGGLDWKTLLKELGKNYVVWFAAVVMITLVGTPGVVCATPMAWLMALPLGLNVAGRSRSTGRSQRVTEAAIAGALLGTLQAILFWAVVGLIGDIKPDERVNGFVLNLIVLGVGAAACAGLAAVMGMRADTLRRKQAS